MVSLGPLLFPHSASHNWYSFISVMLLLCIVKDEFVERKKDDVRQISASVVFTIPTLFQRDQYRLLVREPSDGHSCL